LDLLQLNNGSASLVWLNDGAGSFRNTDAPNSFSHESAALGDVDGDGDLDVVTSFDSGGSTGSLDWLRNDHNGEATPLTLFQLVDQEDVALADVDGDGDLDAFVARGSGQSDYVFLNDGTGNFTDSGQRLGVVSSVAVALADFDGDGDVDAYVVHEGAPDTLYFNDGSGQF
ncbi:MAG: VCBS repeat-containing protein, partial [Planctomycetes bacterium]|nr:VCBS repeat-containing protein [Planctomycetota bacterium]